MEDLFGKRITSEKDLLQIFNNLPNGVGVFEVDGEKIAVKYLNDGCYSMLGLDSGRRDRSFCADPTAFIHPDDLLAVYREINSAIAENSLFNCTVRILCDDGSFLWISICAKWSLQGSGKYLFYASCTDVDEKKKNEEHLAETASIITAAMDCSSMLCWEYHPESRTAVFGNKESPLFSGNRLIKNFPQVLAEQNFIHPEYRERLFDTFRKIDMGQESASCEVKLRYSDGWHWKNISLTSVYSREGLRLKVIGTSETLDAYKELEERFAISAAQSGLTTWQYNVQERRIIPDIVTQNIPCSFTVIENVPESIISNGSLHPDDIEVFRAMYRKIETGVKSAQCDCRWKTPDRSWHWRRTFYTVVSDKDGKPIKALGASVDISEQKEAEEKYEKYTESLSAINPLAIGSFRFNLTKDTCWDGHSAYQSIMSLQKDGTAEGFFKSAARYSVNPDNPEFAHFFNRKNLIKAFREGKSSLSLDHQFRMDDDTKWITTFINMAKNPLSGEIEAVIYSIDINQKKLAEQIINTVTLANYDQIILIDAKKNTARRYIGGLSTEPSTIYTNDSKKRTEEYLRQYYGGSDIEDFIAKTRLSYVTEQLKLHGLYVLNYLMKDNDKGSLRRKRGEYRYLDRGEGLICFTRMDITEIFEMEQKANSELSAALKRAERACLAKSEFLSRMSHDMRTPLNAVIGLSSLARDSVSMSEIKAYMDKINISGQYLLGLINDVLDMSKIENKKLELCYETIETEVFFRNIIEIVQPLMDAKHLCFRLDLCRTAPKYFCCDRLHLQQVYINLLSNSIKFTPEYGHIECSVSILGTDDKFVYSQMVLKDSGIGMSEEFLKHVFEPFEQEYHDKGGTGLGLPIVKNLIELMGGELTIESKKGCGTTVTVRLKTPVCGLPANELPSVKELRTERSFKGKRILVAEDQPINTLIITKILSKEGITADCAENGLAAVKMFAASPVGFYDAILMDIRMPIMNGVKTAKVIRKMMREDAKTIPIIAMTADAFDKDMQRAQEYGLDGYTAKPIMPEELFSLLYSLIK